MAEQSPNFEIATEIKNVTKRDGILAPFDSSKIYNAILKAGTSTGEFKEAELIKSLKRVSPTKLYADAKGDTAHSGSDRFAYQIVRLYNKKKQYRLDEREIR